MIVLWFWWAVGLTITTVSVGCFVRRNREVAYGFLMAILATYVVSANLFAPRLVEIHLVGTSAVVVTGSLIWPFTSQIIDMITEIYGRRRAYAAVAAAFICYGLFVTFVWLAVSSGATPIWSTEQEHFWEAYFVLSGRILFASMTSAIISMSVDVAVFDSLRQRWWNREKADSLRGIVAFAGARGVTSDLVNMAIDGPLFAILAFAFVLPWDNVIQLAFGSFMLKAFLAVADKPWFVAFRMMTRDVKRAR